MIPEMDLESQEIIKKIAKERIKREKTRNERIHTLMNSIDYIEWLIRFTNDKQEFITDDWAYYYEKLDVADQEKVKELSLFYEGINNYAKKNYLYATTKEYDEYYLIRIGDIGFEIGITTEQGTKYYCKRVSIEENFIDLLDIITDKKQGNVDYIKENFDALSTVINNLYDSGVPLDAINDTFDKITSKIIRNNELNDKPKVLYKKI